MIRSICCNSLLACSFSLFSSDLSAAVVFQFMNNEELDGGMQMTRGGITLSTTAVHYRDLTNPTSPGAILTSGGSTSINLSNGIGIDNPTITANSFQTTFGPGDETNNFNFDESWIFQFDQDVIFDELDFVSLDAQDRFRVSIAGNEFIFDNGPSFDKFTDPFAGTNVVAGTSISFLFDPTNQDGSSRIASFTVTASAVPEPSTTALLGMIVLGGILSQRHRHRLHRNES